MRILHVVPTYLPATRYGGPILSVHGLCRALARRGHDVEIFTTNVDGAGDSDVPLDAPVEIDGVIVNYFPSQRLRRLYWSPPMFDALANGARDFDIAHLHSVFLWPTMAAARACANARVPYVIAPRGMLVRELVAEKNRLLKTAWIHLVERSNFARASAIHFTSTLELQEAGRFSLPLPHPFVIPNGIDLVGDHDPNQPPPIAHELDSDRRPPTAHSPVILFLGRINWKKGLDRLIRGLALVEGVSLTIAGNDDEDYADTLRAIARAECVSDRIVFAGWVDGESKQSLLRTASALVLPSRNENFGNVVVEAMATGCPVIVTRDVGAGEIVETARCGLVVDGGPASLAEAIQLILRDPRSAREMGDRGHAAVERSLTWDAIAERMETVYERIVAQ